VVLNRDDYTSNNKTVKISF